MEGFRNYNSSLHGVRENYMKNRTRQTVEYVKRMRETYCVFTQPVPIWEIFERLDAFVDASDPDLSLSNNIHGFQTAEQMRKDGQPDWLQLVGLIHDIGKIMFVKGCDKDGTSVREQWGIVGDTFIVGCSLSPHNVYPELNELNPDMKDPIYSTEYGIYAPHCGLDQVTCSWGHDEYLYQMLLANKTKIPDEGLYIIRFHSLYPYHSKGDYSRFMSQKDKDHLGWLRCFSQYDLYTKSEVVINVGDIKEYYSGLINKYIGKDYLLI